MSRLGRGLQIAGLVVAPLAMLFQLVPKPDGDPVLSSGEMLRALVAAVCLFLIGRLVEGYARR